MHVEQTKLWENVNHNVNTDMGKGVLAYQANMPESGSAFGVQKEKYEKLAGCRRREPSIWRRRPIRIR